MKYRLTTLAALLALAWPLARAEANPIVVPEKPAPREPPKTGLVITTDDRVPEAHLQIPRSLFEGLRAEAAEPEPGTQRAEAPASHLVVAGLALASAMTLGGFWLVRGRHRFSGTLVLLVAVGLLAVSAGTVLADIPGPGRHGRPQPSPPAVQGGTLSEHVTVEVVDRGDAITLIVKRDDLAKVLGK